MPFSRNTGMMSWYALCSPLFPSLPPPCPPSPPPFFSVQYSFLHIFLPVSPPPFKYFLPPAPPPSLLSLLDPRRCLGANETSRPNHGLRRGCVCNGRDSHEEYGPALGQSRAAHLLCLLRAGAYPCYPPSPPSPPGPFPPPSSSTSTSKLLPPMYTLILSFVFFCSHNLSIYPFIHS